MYKRISTYEYFTFTEVTATNVNLNKSYELIDNKIQKKSNANMSEGSFTIKYCDNLAIMDNYFKSLNKKTAIIAGKTKKDNLKKGYIVPSGHEYEEEGLVSRTNSCFTESETSLLLLDFDPSIHMPENMKNIKSPDELRALLIQIIPELNEIEHFIKPSSSSSVFNSNTNEYVNNTGSYHSYIVVTNCNKENLDRFIEYFKRKSLQVGLCYTKIHKDASTTYSTLIDLAPIKSLKSRLIFESLPSVKEPLCIKQQETKFYNIGSKKALDLSYFNPNELPDYRPAYEEYKKKIKPLIEQKKNDYKAKKIDTLISSGINKDTAKKMTDNFLEKKTLSCYDYLTDSNGLKEQIFNLLLNNSNEYYNDIVEEDKKGKVFIQKNGIFDSKIKTFCRGGVEYKITFDFNSIIYILQNLNSKDIKYKIKCLVALENLLYNDILKYDEIIEIEKILKQNSFLSENNSFLKKVFDNILEKKSLNALENYVVLLSNGAFSILDLSQNKLTAYKPNDIKNFFKNKKISAYDFESQKYKKFNPFDIWLESPQRREFTKISFDPAEKCDEKTFNQFRGFRYKPQNLIDISLYHDLLKNVICSGNEFMYGIIWSFFAQIIQEPAEKFGVCLVLMSKMGTGKGTAIMPIIDLLEGYSLVTSDSDTIFSRFNNHLSNTLLIYFNEAAELNYNKSLISKFKHLITEKITSYEIKNGPTYVGPSMVRMIIDTNEDSLIKESADSRRNWYLPISEDKIGDKEFFEKLYKLYKTDGFYETLMYQLITFDLKPWKPLLRSPIKNEVFVEQQLQSLNEIQSWWISCLEENTIIDAYYELTGNNEIKISNQELYDSYVKFTKKSGKKVYDQKPSFGKLMKKYCINNELVISSNAKDKRGDNAKIYASLKKCCIYFLNKHKLENHEINASYWQESKYHNNLY